MAQSKPKMITSVFRDRYDAIDVYDWLRVLGYTPDQISVLMSDQTRSYYANEVKEGKIERGSKLAEGAATGGALGTAIGAGLAAFAAIGTSLVLPGLGLVIAGPIAAAFAGGGAGAVAGGLIGGLVGYGIPESNAKAYEEALRDGGVAVGVVPRNSEEASLIKKEFEKRRGDNIITA
ncbi:MAG: hypothetical protein QM703_18370 [Gemmatales bacterium]